MSASARRLTGVTADRIRWPRPDAIVRGGRAGGPGSATPGAPLRGRLIESAQTPTPADTAEELTAVQRDAFAKGYAQGERAGDAAAGQRNEGMVRRLVATIEEIASLRAGMMRTTERELVRLAVSMAERIVRREVEVDAELLSAMARVAIDRLGENVAATIHLNPVDYEAMMAARQGAAFGGAVQVVADALVGRGGCLVKSAFGVVDAGIDTQIREMSHALLGDEAAAAPAEARPNGVPTSA
jgi:flagellar biosynthesis/type III secretory pathway protein FliH